MRDQRQSSCCQYRKANTIIIIIVMVFAYWSIPMYVRSATIYQAAGSLLWPRKLARTLIRYVGSIMPPRPPGK